MLSCVQASQFDNSERPIVITSESVDSNRVKRVLEKGATVLKCKVEKSSGHICLDAAMSMLQSQHRIDHGRGRSIRVNNSFLDSGLGDEVIVTVAPCFLLGGLEYGTTESKKRLGLLFSSVGGGVSSMGPYPGSLSNPNLFE